MNKLKTGPWNLTDLKNVKPNGLKVFSCFHCGGGSTMGYKLAGYEVLGGVEIDPEMMEIYKINHNPKYSYLMGVQDFKKIPNEKLPQELFNLDILDGSPPCSSFSMAGSREKAWGENKKFREGQAYQVLDDLFFDFIDIAKKLKPKVVVAENVKGLISGKAKGYVKQIFQKFRDAGYETQLFLLNSSRMGVPQKRERTFFIANKINKKIKLHFDEPVITVEKAWFDLKNQISKPINEKYNKVREYCLKNNTVRAEDYYTFVEGKRKQWNTNVIMLNQLSPTLTSSGINIHPLQTRHLSKLENYRIQTFPDNFNNLKTDSKYVCGMSVPPFMMQRVADQIYKQFFLEA